jgi:hypothetical protein
MGREDKCTPTMVRRLRPKVESQDDDHKKKVSREVKADTRRTLNRISESRMEHDYQSQNKDTTGLLFISQQSTLKG